VNEMTALGGEEGLGMRWSFGHSYSLHAFWVSCNRVED
jgi:hypothetical protein